MRALPLCLAFFSLFPVPASSQLTMTVEPQETSAVLTGARFVRWTILERRGPANSVQVADLAIIGATGAVQPWNAGATVVNADGASPPGEGPAMLLDLTVGHRTKWLSLRFGEDSGTMGRQTVVIDNKVPLPAVIGLVWWAADDEPNRDPVTWTLDLSRDGVTWVRADSVREVPTLTRHEGTTRRIPNLVPLPVLPVVVGTMPVCAGHPIGFVVRTGTTAALERTERTAVVQGGVCRGVVTLASATRYAAHVLGVNGWRSPAIRYTSRASAVAAVLAAPVAP